MLEASLFPTQRRHPPPPAPPPPPPYLVSYMLVPTSNLKVGGKLRDPSWKPFRMGHVLLAMFSCTRHTKRKCAFNHWPNTLGHNWERKCQVLVSQLPPFSVAMMGGKNDSSYMVGTYQSWQKFFLPSLPCLHDIQEAVPLRHLLPLFNSAVFSTEMCHNQSRIILSWTCDPSRSVLLTSFADWQKISTFLGYHLSIENL